MAAVLTLASAASLIADRLVGMAGMAMVVPFGVGKYVMGLFETSAGPLYVNPGIGWFPVPIRFNCRPEITVVEI